MATQTKSTFSRVWNRIDSLVRNTINPTTWPGANAFLRFGRSGVASTQDFELVDMQPRELYVGQLYSAIRTRANRVADLAKNHTKTRLFDDPKLDLDDEQHPYLTLINQSPTFSNTYFWKAMSTFIDLTGCSYIYVLRNAKGNLVGASLEFKIVNPYNLTRVVKGSDPTDYHYIETRGQLWREIPKEQLIICQSFNPFNLNDGFGMVEAAQDDHFAIKQARDYTRKAIRKNVGQRGLLTTDVILDDPKFANFVESIKSGQTGDFLFGNGPNAVSYTDMQIDLDKLALDKINKISTDSIIMVSGVSKTLLGVEESGTTRDTAKVQKDLFTENHAIPQLDIVLDALNQDYKNNYQAEYLARRLELFVDSPLKVDKETELKDSQIEKTKAETATTLIDAGFQPDSVMQYLELDAMLKFEERQPRPGTQPPIPPKEEPDDENPDEETQQNFLNQFSPGLDTVVKGHEATLANQIEVIEGQVLHAVLPKLTEKFAKNQLTEEEKVINKDDYERLERDLTLILSAFGVAMVSLFAGQTMNKRFLEFALPVQFTMNKSVNDAITANAQRAATSHMDTFVKATFEEARKAGMEGLSRAGIVSRLTTQFPSLARTNATRIARTESYKAVNLSQYEADKQFLSQSKLTKRAYKKWRVQSANPCSYCVAMSEREPVAFDANFLDIGDSIKAEFQQDGGTVTREYIASYESVGSGTLHPNCSCTYDLIIKEG